jgi:hypothetical protein
MLTRWPFDDNAGASVLEPHRTHRASRAHGATVELDADDGVVSNPASILGRDLDDHRHLGLVTG